MCVSLFYVIDTGSTGPRARPGGRTGGYLSTPRFKIRRRLVCRPTSNLIGSPSQHRGSFETRVTVSWQVVVSTLKWACSTTFQKDSAKQSSTPKSTQVRAVPERGSPGQTQHKGTAAGTAYAALVARRRSRRGLVSSARTAQQCVLRLFYYYTKLTGNRVSLFFLSKKPCSVLFFSPFSPKLGLQNLTGARIACTLTVTLLPHSLRA